MPDANQPIPMIIPDLEVLPPAKAGSVPLDNEQQARLNELGNELRTAERKLLASPNFHTRLIREKTGVKGYSPVGKYTRAEAEALGLCAPAEAFPDLEGRNLEDDPAVAAELRRLGLKKKDVEPVFIPPVAPSKEIAEKWKADAEKVSSTIALDLPPGFDVRISSGADIQRIEEEAEKDKEPPALE